MVIDVSIEKLPPAVWVSWPRIVEEAGAIQDRELIIFRKWLLKAINGTFGMFRNTGPKRECAWLAYKFELLLAAFGGDFQFLRFTHRHNLRHTFKLLKNDIPLSIKDPQQRNIYLHTCLGAPVTMTPPFRQTSKRSILWRSWLVTLRLNTVERVWRSSQKCQKMTSSSFSSSTLTTYLEVSALGLKNGIRSMLRNCGSLTAPSEWRRPRKSPLGITTSCSAHCCSSAQDFQ
jgi:hypothetical protein